MDTYFRIRELRLAAGLTQIQLAARLELNRSSTVTMWERGTRHPPSILLPRIAKELGCTIDDLYVKSQKVL